LENKPKCICYNKYQIIAIFLLFSLLIVSAFVVPILIESNTENSDIAQPRTFPIHLAYNFSNSPAYDSTSGPDIEFDLAMHYPRGTLIVDDPVEISGIAVLNSPRSQNVKSISIGFQNSLAWPITQDSKGISQETNLFLNRAQGGRLLGNATIVWVVEGTYSPKITLDFFNGPPQPTASSDVAITVYPKSQLAQLVTNKASIDLAFAAFFLALVGTLNIIYNLWVKGLPSHNRNNFTPKNNGKCDDKTKNDPSPHDNLTKKRQ
jgi:hypothetical protein